MKEGLFIGEIAELVGVSKDTLRIYEEQGLLHPDRDENGFRRYGEDELNKLISIRFYRESAFPMKELKELMSRDGCPDKLELLERQIRTERMEELRHRRNRERLELAKTYFASEQGVFSCCTETEWYQMSPSRDSYSELMKDWFSAAKRDPDLSACYLNMEYDLSGSLDHPAAYYLLLKGQDAACLKRPDLVKEGKKIEVGTCFRAVLPAEKPLPDRKDLEAVCECAQKKGVHPAGIVHAHFQYIDEADGRPCFITELLLPLKQMPSK